MSKKENAGLQHRIRSLQIRLEMLTKREDAKYAFDSEEDWRNEIACTQRRIQELETQVSPKAA